MCFDWFLVCGVSPFPAQLFVIAIEDILRRDVGNIIDVCMFLSPSILLSLIKFVSFSVFCEKIAMGVSAMGGAATDVHRHTAATASRE